MIQIFKSLQSEKLASQRSQLNGIIKTGKKGREEEKEEEEIVNLSGLKRESQKVCYRGRS